MPEVIGTHHVQSHLAVNNIIIIIFIVYIFILHSLPVPIGQEYYEVTAERLED